MWRCGYSIRYSRVVLEFKKKNNNKNFSTTECFPCAKYYTGNISLSLQVYVHFNTAFKSQKQDANLGLSGNKLCVHYEHKIQL